MNDIEKWEFGSLEWCKFAAKTGVELIIQAKFDLSKYEWGFSEEYTHLPERLLAGRDKVGWHFMIHNGKVSGGTSLPKECLELPGFHVAIEWALIAHASSFIYDLEGQEKRGIDENKLFKDLEIAGIRNNTNMFKSIIPADFGQYKISNFTPQQPGSSVYLYPQSPPQPDHHASRGPHRWVYRW